MSRRVPPATAMLEGTSSELPRFDGVVPIPKQQLYEKLSRAIIDQVLGGTLTPGQRLPSERELARAYGVSRPSLREALGALQTLGVVETRHGSGSWVSEQALDALADHFATPHMATFSARARRLGFAAPFLKLIRIAELSDLRPADLESLRTTHSSSTGTISC